MIEQIRAKYPRFDRFAHRHPVAANHLVRIARARSRALEGIDLSDPNERDDHEDRLVESVTLQAQQEHPVEFGIIGTIVIAIVTRLVVEWIMSLLD